MRSCFSTGELVAVLREAARMGKQLQMEFSQFCEFSASQVQGLGDVLEIEENAVPGDDGVKIQAYISRPA